MAIILVLGASGFVGTKLCKKLMEDETNYVIGVSRHEPQFCTEYINCDLTDLEQCKKLFTDNYFDVVYQLAAESGNKEYLNSDRYKYGLSTLININILKSANPESIGMLIFTSSFYAEYPDTSYGLEKLYNEALFRKSKFNIKIVRLNPVYGYTSKPEKVVDSLCYKFATAKEQSVINISTDDYKRNFIYVEDVITELVNQKDIYPDEDTRVVEFRTANTYSVYELARKINSISGKNICIKEQSIIFDKYKESLPVFRCLDYVYLPTSLEEGLKLEYYEYVKDYTNGTNRKE